MSHTPKQKRTSQRRLTVEMMETRLMLSVSPTEPVDLKDLNEVALVPPEQGAAQPDTLDFHDMAAQFNDAHTFGQVDDLVPLRQLPPADAGDLKLEDPSTFLGTTTQNVYQTTDSLPERLADQSATIVWSVSMQADGSVSQGASSITIGPANLPKLEANRSEITVPESETTDANRSMESFRETMDTHGGDNVSDRDFTQLNHSWFSDDLHEAMPTLRLDLRPVIENFEGDYTIVFATDEQGFISFDMLPQEGAYGNGMVGIGGVFMDAGSDHALLSSDFIPEMADSAEIQARLLGDFAGSTIVDAAAFEWIVTSSPWIPSDFNRDAFGNSWDLQTPPMPSTPGARDALIATANSLYQDWFDGQGMDTDASLAMSQQDLADRFYSDSQTPSRVLQGVDDEGGTYEENTLLGELGSSDGTTSEGETVELTFFEKQDDSESDELEIEGIMSSDAGVLLVDTESTGEEGGMVDFTIAMNWSQKPVVATVEGIVEASVQQDNQVALEGSYGRGQTFELATVDDVEAATSETSTLENVSATLLEELNNMPLENHARENLDKTDLTPTAHEMALREMNQELDYAAMLPADALSWVTFAMVGQIVTRHPLDRKKKQDEK